jgi:hypothetical protein
MTLREITNELNNSGFQTSKGLAFHPEQVRRLFNCQMVGKHLNYKVFKMLIK